MGDIQSMEKLPFLQFSMELRSGKIIEHDEGFLEILGYSEEEMETGEITLQQFVPSVEYNELTNQLRAEFLDKRYVSYRQEFVANNGNSFTVAAFYKIENKLLAGHRVIKVTASVV